MKERDEKIKLISHCVGMNLYNARKRVLRIYPELSVSDIDITYLESDFPRFTVLDCIYDSAISKIKMKVSSLNPIRHLPSNYQENDFLRNFLMIFQHIMNETSITLDNIHEYYRPMESPASFLPELSEWLGINLDTVGGEDEIRKFLQYAITLYRYRGTAIGISTHLAIVSGVMPRIIEGQIPYKTMTIMDDSDIESHLIDEENINNCFTIFFPVEKKFFSETMLQRISTIINNEKPVHTTCYINFLKSEKKKRKVTTISNNTTMDSDIGITI